MSSVVVFAQINMVQSGPFGAMCAAYNACNPVAGRKPAARSVRIRSMLALRAPSRAFRISVSLMATALLLIGAMRDLSRAGYTQSASADQISAGAGAGVAGQSALPAMAVLAAAASVRSSRETRCWRSVNSSLPRS
jgi:hypothetical protein